MFVHAAKPWAGGGSNGEVVVAIISNTLSVTEVGDDTQVELINGFTNVEFSNQIILSEFSNNQITTGGNFTLGPNNGTTDGAVINCRFDGNVVSVLSIDPSIVIPDELSSTFPFTIQTAGVVYLSMQFDAFKGTWYISEFSSVANGVTAFSSGTLAVTGNDIELIAPANIVIPFVNPLQPTENTTRVIDATTDFTLTAPSGTTDGATVNLVIGNDTEAGAAVSMSLDDTILVPPNFASDFPVSLTFTNTPPNFTPFNTVFLTLRFSDFAGSWYVANFLNLTTPA
jgi:hypothetical protein